MAIEKSLYEAPQGLAAIDAPDIEIEIEDPEAVRIGMGDFELEILPSEIEDFNENIAESLSDSVLQTLGSELVDEFSGDVDSRKEACCVISAADAPRYSYS